MLTLVGFGVVGGDESSQNWIENVLWCFVSVAGARTDEYLCKGGSE